MGLGLVFIGCFLEETLEHVVCMQHCRVCRLINWGGAEQAGGKLGGGGGGTSTDRFVAA